jgi:hypothetical protein
MARNEWNGRLEALDDLMGFVVKDSLPLDFRIANWINEQRDTARSLKDSWK